MTPAPDVYKRQQQYYPTELSGEMELTSLIGNVTRKDGAVYLHMHATFADGEAKVWGGHLNSARISATAEIFIRKVQGYVDRKQDEQTGINLLSL